MTKFQVVITYPDGTVEEEDELFDSEEEAQAHGSNVLNSISAGAETLHDSNPGDYPSDECEADYEVIEVDD